MRIARVGGGDSVDRKRKKRARSGFLSVGMIVIGAQVLASAVAAAPVTRALPNCSDSNAITITSKGFQTIRGPEPMRVLGEGARPVRAHRLFHFAADPIDANLMYAARFDALFVSSDGGCSWKPVFRLEDHVGTPGNPVSCTVTLAELGGEGHSPWPVCPIIDAVVTGSRSAKRGVVFVQTRTWVYANQPGVMTSLFKSTDAGATWEQIDGVAGLNSTQLGMGHVSVAPSSPDTIYVSRFDPWWNEPSALTTSVPGDPLRGVHTRPPLLFRSRDGGKTWDSAPLPGNPNRAGGNFVFYPSVAIDEEDPMTLWATAGDTLYRSSDGGQQWSPLYTPRDLKDAQATSENGRGSQTNILAWDVARGSSGPVIALVTHPGDNYRQNMPTATYDQLVHVSRDGGQTWTEIPFPDGMKELRVEVAFSATGRSLIAIETQAPISGGETNDVARLDVRRGLWTTLRVGTPHPQELSYERTFALSQVGTRFFFLSACELTYGASLPLPRGDTCANIDVYLGSKRE